MAWRLTIVCDRVLQQVWRSLGRETTQKRLGEISNQVRGGYEQYGRTTRPSATSAPALPSAGRGGSAGEPSRALPTSHSPCSVGAVGTTCAAGGGGGGGAAAASGGGRLGGSAHGLCSAGRRRGDATGGIAIGRRGGGLRRTAA